MSIFATNLSALSNAVSGFEIAAEVSYKAKDITVWKQSMQGLLQVSEELIDLFGLAWKKNPHVMPETPAEWTQSVDEAIKAFHALRRQARKGKDKVSIRFQNKMLRILLKLEEATVLQARAMKAQFESQWPHLWTKKKKDKYRSWYAKRFR